MKNFNRVLQLCAVMFFSQQLLASVSRFTPHDSRFSPRVIYGQDNVRELYEIRDPMKLRIAQSSVALLNKDNIKLIDDSYWLLNGPTLRSENNMCSTERFAEQKSFAYCSGSLIGPDTVLTAGHCIKTAKDCADTRLAFGLQLSGAGAHLSTLPLAQVFRCARVLHSVEDEDGLDFAVVQLDREAKGYTPVTMRTEGSLTRGEALWMIGYPLGMPAKVVDVAQVREDVDETAVSFVTNLDAFYNNSGSPVFNAVTGLLEGVLIEGEDDFSDSPNDDFSTPAGGTCKVIKRCADDSCMGETVIKIGAILRHLNHQ